MALVLESPCKVNLVLNILGRRPDGFHELETLMQPVPWCDRLSFDLAESGVEFTCDDARLPADGTNLVVRAARGFLEAADVPRGVRIHLEKRIPLAAGLGGGSGDAATTLVGLNRLFGAPLSRDRLDTLAAALGSDVPFFLYGRPALATGRGEQVSVVEPFAGLRGCWLVLAHPGFGVATAWAYRELGKHPLALNGQPGRAAEVARRLKGGDLSGACAQLYNVLEIPVLRKHPILALYQEFFREAGAVGTLMSGSGSTTFAIVTGEREARAMGEGFVARFGRQGQTAVVPIPAAACGCG
jgi:4-diphosphocytidyl-2-C-methyl-D-erythritol kinase